MSAATRLLPWALLFGASIQLLPAQPFGAGKGLQTLVEANELMGRKLLQHLQRQAPDRNIVVSPLSASLPLLAIRSQGFGGPDSDEIGQALNLSGYQNFYTPSKMLLADLSGFSKDFGGAHFESAFLYRPPNWWSASFTSFAKESLQTKFIPVQGAGPTKRDIQRNRPAAGKLPEIPAGSRGAFSSSLKLATPWSGNTFGLYPSFPLPFYAAGGAGKADFMTSELSKYPHAVTPEYEAVALPADSAYMVLILPAKDQSVATVLQSLAADPGQLDAELRSELGLATVPRWHFTFAPELREPLEGMGIRQVFKGLEYVCRTPGCHLTGINQRIEMRVDESGIYAEAETVTGSHPGGLLSTPDYFRMTLNRPFVFLVRSQATNALLLAGVVADPTAR